MSKFFGVSMGETGQYGIGDIVMGEEIDIDIPTDPSDPDRILLDGEPVYNVFQLKDENDGTEVEGVEIEYVK